LPGIRRAQYPAEVRAASPLRIVQHDLSLGYLLAAFQKAGAV